MSNRRLLIVLTGVELLLIGSAFWLSWVPGGFFVGPVLIPMLLPSVFVASLIVGVLCGLRPNR